MNKYGFTERQPLHLDARPVVVEGWWVALVARWLSVGLVALVALAIAAAAAGIPARAMLHHLDLALKVLGQ